MTSPSAVEATEDSPAAFRKPVVLLTELFPPDVGGTPSLFENVYSRISARPVTVLTDTRDGAAATSVRVIRFPMSTHGHWGLTSTASFGRHLRVARQLRAEMAPAPVIVHCARVLPEGLSAWMATRLHRSSRYVC